MLSLTQEMIDRLLEETLPSYQATSRRDHNLGFGYIFYAFARALRPSTVVVVGSKAGFSVVCFALALRDNMGSGISEVGCYDTSVADSRNLGRVYFVDPSRNEGRGDAGHWHGIGFWDDPGAVKRHWTKFGVEMLVDHYKCTSAQFIASEALGKAEIDILYIDGDHSYEGVTHDFNEFYQLLRPDALILAHDVDPRLHEIDPDAGGYRAISSLDPRKFEVCRLAIFPGLAIARMVA